MYYGINAVAIQMTEIDCLKMSTRKVIITVCIFYISFLNVLFIILRKMLYAAYEMAGGYTNVIAFNAPSPTWPIK